MNLLKRASIMIVAASMAMGTFAARLAEHVDRTLGRIFDFILSAVTAAPMRFAGDGPQMARRNDRPSIEPSLLEGLRHEKGVSRLGAARGI